MERIVLVGIVAACLMCGCSKETPMGPDEIRSRAEPAVYKVLAVGDIEVSCPDMDANTDLLHRQYERDPADATSFPGYAWEKIADNPSRYLVPRRRIQLSARRFVYSSGTTFAVNEVGWLLTNAHVVADPGSELLPQAALLVLDRILPNMSTELGGAPPDDRNLQEKLAKGLVEWLVPQCRFSGHRTDVRVVKWGFWERLEIPTPIDCLYSPKRCIKKEQEQDFDHYSVSAEVRSRGEPWPGRDVAVLLMPPTPDMISIPLGDASQINDIHNPIYAMGFPGAAIIPGVKEDPASPILTTHPGIIDRAVTTEGKWTAFHMTADINHGDSGGPVLDASGKVVGLNVAINPKGAPGQAYAVPINVAKKFLTEAGVGTDVGVETRNWLAGHHEFWQQHYSSALKYFTHSSPPDEKVEDMIKRCREKIQAGEDRSSLLDRFWKK